MYNNMFWGRKRLPFFEEAGDGGGGAAGAGNDGAGAGNDGAGAGGTDEIKLSSRAFNERLKRAEKKGQDEFLKSLGYEKSDDLKTLLDEVKAGKEAQKTELQKLQEKTNALESEKASILKTATLKQLEADLKIAAIEKGVPAAKMGYLIKLLDTESITADKIGESIDALLKDFPELIQAKPPGKAGSNFGGDPVIDMDKLTAADYANPAIWDKLMKQNKK